MECHLESIDEWSGASKLLQNIRRSKTEVKHDTYEAAVAETIQDIDQSNWTVGFEKRTKEIYMFLLPKLNTGLAILVGPVDNMNGFELWRSVLKEEDPIHKNEEFHMELDVRQLCSTRCKNFKESRNS